MTGGIRRHRTAIPGWARRLALAGSFLACLALLLNLLVWSLYAPAMAAGITTPICTAPISKSPDGKGVGPVDLSARHCPLGLLAVGLAAPPAGLPLPVLSWLSLFRLWPDRLLLAVTAQFIPWNARAPPLV